MARQEGQADGANGKKVYVTCPNYTTICHASPALRERLGPIPSKFLKKTAKFCRRFLARPLLSVVGSVATSATILGKMTWKTERRKPKRKSPKSPRKWKA